MCINKILDWQTPTEYEPFFFDYEPPSNRCQIVYFYLKTIITEEIKGTMEYKAMVDCLISRAKKSLGNISLNNDRRRGAFGKIEEPARTILQYRYFMPNEETKDERAVLKDKEINWYGDGDEWIEKRKRDVAKIGNYKEGTKEWRRAVYGDPNRGSNIPIHLE